MGNMKICERCGREEREGPWSAGGIRWEICEECRRKDGELMIEDRRRSHRQSLDYIDRLKESVK